MKTSCYLYDVRTFLYFRVPILSNMLRSILFIFIFFCAFVSIAQGQELAATITIQSNKVDNQVDPKTFIQLQSQLKDFIN